MTNPTTDQDIVGWMLKGAAALILFLLSLGVKDIKDRIRDAERLCARIEALEERIVSLERMAYGKKTDI